MDPKQIQLKKPIKPKREIILRTHWLDNYTDSVSFSDLIVEIDKFSKHENVSKDKIEVAINNFGWLELRVLRMETEEEFEKKLDIYQKWLKAWESEQ